MTLKFQELEVDQFWGQKWENVGPPFEILELTQNLVLTSLLSPCHNMEHNPKPENTSTPQKHI